MRRIALALWLGCCACAAPHPQDEENVPPVARVFFPQVALVDAPASFDASGSFDDDGEVLTWTLQVGDGTPAASSADGSFVHVYASPGTFEFHLLVADEAGASATANGGVVVVADDASCSCELGCLPGARCTPRGCESFSSSDTDDEDTPSDALECG